MLDGDPAILRKPSDAAQQNLHGRAAVFDLEHQTAAEQAETFHRTAVSDQRDQRPRARFQQALRHPALTPEGRGGAAPLQGILPGEHLEAVRFQVGLRLDADAEGAGFRNGRCANAHGVPAPGFPVVPDLPQHHPGKDAVPGLHPGLFPWPAARRRASGIDSGAHTEPGPVPSGPAPDLASAQCNSHFHITWFGDASHSGPLASPGDTATWSGVMSGVEASPRSGPGAFVHGDSAVTVSGLAAGVQLSVDVAFTDIVNGDTAAGIGDMVWRGLPLQGREFGTDSVLFNDGSGYFRDESFGTAAEGRIYGRLYGPGHEEVGGLFHRDGIAGAFAGKRDR